jgi:hypothetical protein
MVSRPDQPVTEFGDIRDRLTELPYPPNDGTAYALTDLFTVRHEIIRGLTPAPRSVFEFGALLGFFLVTALDAAPTIRRAGWVDDESHTPGSNDLCRANIRHSRRSTPMGSYWGHEWRTNRGDLASLEHQQWDLVQVDSDHSFEGCLLDLEIASAMNPRWIMVDDWTAITHRQPIRAAVRTWLEETHGDWELSEHHTQNGLALLTRV